MNSILGRLLSWQIGTLIVTTAFITALTYQTTWSQFNHSRDMALEQIAWAVMRHQGMHPELYDLTAEQESIISQVWNDNNLLIFASRPDQLLPRQKPGLSSFTFHDKDWHAFVIHDRGVTVQISNPADVRELWFKEFGGALFVPFSLMVIIMGSFIAIAATQAFKPIRELRQEIQARNPEFLPPLNNDFYPDELRVIVDALNDMLKRLDDAFLARQRFIAEAAHELRTPITAIRLNAEVLLTEQRQQAPSEAADNLQRGVERASHLVSQLLHLARFDPKFASARQFATVDLVDLAKTVVIEYDTLAARKAIDIGLIAPPQATLFGDMEALRILLSNLVDNAIRYTPEGGCIDVVIETSISALELSVIDNGPGIPEKDRKRAFEPFCRLNNNLPGSGLGLAIAEEIIQQHGAEIELSDSPNGGLTVRVLLPNSGRCQSLLP